MKIVQYTKDGAKAVVIARSINDGFGYLKMYAPMEDWSTSTPFFITECRGSLTPRVLSMEPVRLVQTNNRLHRRCQRAESLVFKYRRRYAAVRDQRVLMKATERCLTGIRAASELYFSQKYAHKCWVCRLTRFFFWR